MVDTEQAICAAICRGDGLKAKDIAAALGMDRKAVNQVLYRSPLLHELCWQDDEYRWHGIVRQHGGILHRGHLHGGYFQPRFLRLKPGLISPHPRGDGGCGH